MSKIERLFLKNEWALVQDILKNGKKEKWLFYAQKYNIKITGTEEQRRKAANDIFRKYLRKQKIVSNMHPSILIYDIETARMTAELWWSGKQYVNGSQIISEPKIITIAYKWVGSDKVFYLKWNKKQSDKKLIKTFLKEYNKADMVIGFNNDRFDNRYINSRALRYDLDVNTHVKSFDIMKQAKKLFRLPSYSMNEIAKYVGVETKLQHTGISMWRDIQKGTKKQAKKAMKQMIAYNLQDIVVTEQVYLRLRRYMKNPIHMGVLIGNTKASCPTCGSKKIKLKKTTYTSAGTVQRIMKCKTDKGTFKISNSTFLKHFNNE